MKKIFLISLLLVSCFSQAKELLPDSDEYELKYMTSDLASPFTTKADRILYTGTLLSVASLLYETGSNEDLQRRISNERPLGSFSQIGDIAGQLVPNAAYTLGMVGAYYLSDDPFIKAKSLHRAFYMFETSLYAGAASIVLKTIVNERRPNLHDNHSFPSGHSTTAFAFAGVIGLEHEWYYGVPAYVLAAYVAFSRLNDNAHYLHDTIAGATIGLSYAFGIWYNRHPGNDSQTQQNLFILPTDDLSGSIVNWQYHF